MYKRNNIGWLGYQFGFGISNEKVQEATCLKLKVIQLLFRQYSDRAVLSKAIDKLQAFVTLPNSRYLG
jgi:hypothetical protein